MSSSLGDLTTACAAAPKYGMNARALLLSAASRLQDDEPEDLVTQGMSSAGMQLYVAAHNIITTQRNCLPYGNAVLARREAILLLNPAVTSTPDSPRSDCRCAFKQARLCFQDICRYSNLKYFQRVAAGAPDAEPSSRSRSSGDCSTSARGQVPNRTAPTPESLGKRSSPAAHTGSGATQPAARGRPQPPPASDRWRPKVLAELLLKRFPKELLPAFIPYSARATIPRAQRQAAMQHLIGLYLAHALQAVGATVEQSAQVRAVRR